MIFSAFLLCEAPLKCHSLDSLEPLLPAQRAPSTRHFPVHCLSLLITITCILPSLDTCAVLHRVVLLGACTWEVANKCWANELSRKTKTPKFQNKLPVTGGVVGMKKISFKFMRYLCSDSLSFLWHFTA